MKCQPCLRFETFRITSSETRPDLIWKWMSQIHVLVRRAERLMKQADGNELTDRVNHPWTEKAKQDQTSSD